MKNNNELILLDNYRQIALGQAQIIDVRAAIEFNKGSLENAINIPLLNDLQREQVGIIYKKKGHEAAYQKGLELVSGEIKSRLLDDLSKALTQNPDSIVMCFRGGERSRIVQEWIYKELGIKVPRIKGGFKAMRNFLIQSMEIENLNFDFYLLAGHTGCGKTLAIKKCDKAIDLEALANHRGSSFGAYLTPQPTQIEFEHKLAYQLLAKTENEQKIVILEKEGKMIGRNRLPEGFYQKMLNSPIIVLQTSLEERVQITYDDYVEKDLAKYIKIYPDKGQQIWQEKMEQSIQNLTKRLGAERTNKVLELFQTATKKDREAHKDWIELLLADYYDPMYSYQRSKWQAEVIFEGNQQAVLEFISQLESEQ